MPRDVEDVLLIGGPYDGKRMQVHLNHNPLMLSHPVQPTLDYRTDNPPTTGVFAVDTYRQYRMFFHQEDMEECTFYYHDSLTGRQAMLRLLERYPQEKTDAP